MLLLACFATGSQAQTDISDDQLTSAMRARQAELSQQIQQALSRINWTQAARTTSGTPTYTIPVVVHVVHNYGNECIPDDSIFYMMKSLNAYFLKTSPDTADIIGKYKDVAASTGIAFKLATIAPDGSPTRGIEHIYSYLNTSSGDQAKLHQWPQDQYLNIWVSAQSLSWSTYDPVKATFYPYYDGITFRYNAIGRNTVGPSLRPFAEWLYLPPPCGDRGCYDGDGIPDTPPCGYDSMYHCSDIYTHGCDTPNAQNIMINSERCGIMFTYGQGQYMQYMLQTDFGKRDSLVTPANFIRTGMNDPMPDLLPVPDFSTGPQYVCPGQLVMFRNRSWNDTLTDATWTFSNMAATPLSTTMNAVYNYFRQPGWVTASLTVGGNHTGHAVKVESDNLYVADAMAASALGYTQEFSPSTMDNWPAFNYYKNNFRWQQAGVGCFDGTSMMYTGFDDRPFPENMTGTPAGDYDDFFSPAFDLRSLAPKAYLNFLTSGATRTGRTKFMIDNLSVSYSADSLRTWSPLATLFGKQLSNMGTFSVPYIPSSPADWKGHALALPAAAMGAQVFFRFRYYPGADSTGKSTGNNFYLDHLSFDNIPITTDVQRSPRIGVSIQPNPTAGSASVNIPAGNGFATALVTDLSGKLLYCASGATPAIVTIPAEALQASGLYLVRIITDYGSFIEKLVKE